MPRETLQDLIAEFSPEKLVTFFRRKSSSFKPNKAELTDFSKDHLRDASRLGEIHFSDDLKSKLIVVTARAVKPLSERSGKKAQYEFGRRVLKTGHYDAGIFIYYDAQGSFRFSLIYPQYVGKSRAWSNFRRYTYYVSPELANKTFIAQIGDGDFKTLEKVKESFSLSKVTNDFYKEFKLKFDNLCLGIKNSDGKPRGEEVNDFALLFVIRVIFLGFIQKRKWIGDNEKFLSNLFAEYGKKGFGRDLFYHRWLEPFFFVALNSAPGAKVAYRANEFPEHIEKALQSAPYLNGGLFQRRRLDENEWYITDSAIKEFFDFLFAYNFTIEENTLYDEDLELNPEFLGIIFERLVNKENGAVYTPRTEVDFMCRMALVKWLEKNTTTKVALKDLYELFFKEGGLEASEEQQRRGDLTAAQKKDLIDLLESVCVCDPAVGSGAFLVGMLHVLDEIEEYLRGRIRDGEYKKDAFERKKRIISQSLYGVEVKEWAVWISQLRLWITLFIDAPDDMRSSLSPILPSLDFKVRQGDSLVQRVGKKTFPITGHANIPSSAKLKITQLKTLKNDFYQNKKHDSWEVRHTENQVFKDILNAEIAEKKKELARLGAKPEKQMDFIGNAHDEQLKLDFDKERIDQLNIEIEELSEEKEALKSSERPLIWSIEFSEVFCDKGGFDIIIGNPPYVRQESIADPLEKINNHKEYKNALAEMVVMDFPREFKREKLNAQSDLYAYFYMRSLRLLNDKGIHVFICSNSWMDVGYGVWLQKFLLNYAPIYFIYDNQCERSFEAADINTIISVLGAPIRKVDKDHMVKFVTFKQPFEEVITTKNLLDVENSDVIKSNEIMRVYPSTVNELIKNATQADDDLCTNADGRRYLGEKWGAKYFRTPDFLLQAVKEKKLITLGKVCDLEYGNKPGLVDFFIVPEERVKTLGIERQFLRKIITSTEEIQTLSVDLKDVSKNIFLCNLSKKELSRGNYGGAASYISWGEKQVTKKKAGHTVENIPWPDVASVSGNSPEWYSLSIRDPGDFIVPLLIRERFFFASNPSGIMETNMFYRGRFIDRTKAELGAAILNSTIVYLTAEIYGRQNIEGRFNIYGTDLEILPVPNINLFDKKSAELVLKKYKPLSRRAIMKIRDELIQPDRIEFDREIFKVIGLTEENRCATYQHLDSLVTSRLEKSKSV